MAMIGIRRLCLGVAVLTALASCGTRADDPGLGLLRDVVPELLGRSDDTTSAIDPRAVLTRDIINQAGVPLILVENSSTGSISTLALVATNGPNETWQGGDDVTVTLSREGVLRATRGFGDDLMAADIAATRRALRAGVPASTPRLHVYLTANVGEDRQGYGCTIEAQGREAITIFGITRTLTRLAEVCVPQSATGAAFTNRYWVDGQGIAWVSEQYLSDSTGPLRIEYLLR